MGNYIDVSDIEAVTGVTYDTTTSPTLAQVETYITSAEAEFEADVGVFSEQTFTDEEVDGYSFGLWLRDKLPLNTITSIKTRSGTIFEPTWTEAYPSGTLLFKIDNSDLGKVLLNTPVIGKRNYQVSGTSGYAKVDMPTIIKDLVILYTFRQIFQTEFFDKKGANVTETINVDVYKEVTGGASITSGIGGMNKLIDDKKALFMGKLKSNLI